MNRWVTTTRAQKVEISASMATPSSGTGARSVVNRPARGRVSGSGIVVLFSGSPGKMYPAPRGEFRQLSRKRQAHVAGNTQFHTRREGDPAPHRPFEGRLRQSEFTRPRLIMERLA